jgi:hypothetical protein
MASCCGVTTASTSTVPLGPWITFSARSAPMSLSVSIAAAFGSWKRISETPSSARATPASPRTIVTASNAPMRTPVHGCMPHPLD